MKKTEKILSFCAAAAVLLTATACGGDVKGDKTDLVNRQAILSALENAQSGAYSLTARDHSTTNSKGDSLDTTVTSDYAIDMKAYEKDGQIYSDFLEYESYRSVDAIYNNERLTSGFDLAFRRGEDVYTHAGNWTDYGVETGNFDALVNEVKARGDELRHLSAENYYATVLELPFGGALVDVLGAKIEKDGDGYAVTLDFVAGAEKVYDELIRVAQSRAGSPNMTVGELLENEYLATALPAFLSAYTPYTLRYALQGLFLERYDCLLQDGEFPAIRDNESAESYFGRVLDSSEVYSKILERSGVTSNGKTLRASAASALFGTSEEAVTALTEKKSKIKEQMLSDMFGYRLDAIQSCTLDFTLTASVNKDNHLEQLGYALATTSTRVSGDYTYTTDETLSVSIDKSEPELCDLTGLRVYVGDVPKAGTYEDGTYGYLTVRTLGSNVRYDGHGIAVVREDGFAEVTVELVLSYQDEEVGRFTETHTVPVIDYETDNNIPLFEEVQVTINGQTHTVSTDGYFYIRVQEMYSIENYCQISFGSFFNAEVPFEAKVMTL